jgi:hypothetical protein
LATVKSWHNEQLKQSYINLAAMYSRNKPALVESVKGFLAYSGTPGYASLKLDEDHP